MDAIAFAAGILLRIVSLNFGLEERLEFSSGATSLFQLLEEVEFPTPNPAHPPNALLVLLIHLGLANHIFFILVDIVNTSLLYLTLRTYLDTTAKETTKRENELIRQWSECGRPRLYSLNGELKVNNEVEDEGWSASSERRHETHPPTLPRTIALFYFLSPCSILSCAASSFAGFGVMLAFAAIFAAQRQNAVASALALSAAVFLQGVGVGFILCPPIWAMLDSRKQFAACFVLILAALQISVPDHSLISFSDVRDLRPNVGLWWYLQTEVFEQFRGYFLLLLHSFLFLVASLLHVFLHPRPLIHAHFGLAVMNTFQPFPEVFHVSLVVILLFCHPEFLVTSTTRRSLAPCLLTLVAVVGVFQPLMLHLWVERGSGNANYYYFQCLISNGILAILLVQFFLAVVTREAVLRRVGRYLKEKKDG